MKTLIEFIKQRASDEAKASEQWANEGNANQRDQHALASNTCLEIIDFYERNSQFIDDHKEKRCLACGHGTWSYRDGDHFRVQCDNENCLSVIVRGESREGAMAEWNRINTPPQRTMKL